MNQPALSTRRRRSGSHALPLHGRGPSVLLGPPAHSFRLRLDLLGEIGGKPNLSNCGKLPLKVIDMLF